MLNSITNSSFQQQSDNFFSALEGHFSKKEFSLWLKDIKTYSASSKIENNILQLGVFSETRLHRIKNYYSKSIAALAQQYFEDIKSVNFYLLSEKEAEAANEEASSSNYNSISGQSSQPLETFAGGIGNAIKQIPSSEVGQPLITTGSIVSAKADIFRRSWTSPHHALPLTNHSFSTFVECPENDLALKFARRVTTQFSKNSPLYFFGPVGVGKTHLLYSVMQEVQRLFPFYKARYMTPHHFVAEFTAALKAKKDREFRMYYHSLDLLIIDDVQFFMGKEKTAIEFFHLFNSIYAPGKQMLIASDRRPSELGGLENRLKSRLAGSVVIEMQAPAVESREKILSFYLQQMGLQCPQEVISYIAANIEGDVRKITGMVRTLSAIADVRGKNFVDMDMCKNLLSTFSVHQKQVVSEAKVIKSVLKYYGLTPTVFLGSGRGKFVARARQVATYLLKKHTSLTMKEIGNAVGGRAASTVVHGVQLVAAIAETSEMRMALTEIERNFTELD